MFCLKRAYAPPKKSDGVRILVERLWPRGISKGDAAIDLWLKDIAPSTALRQWFDHDPAKWLAFQRRYWKELSNQREAIALLRKKSHGRTITLVYAARDEEHNGALALLTYLKTKR